MTFEQISVLIQDTIRTALFTVGPVLAGAMVVGLAISIFQAATQINEQTLTFIPKIVTVLGLFALLFPWIMGQITEFGARLFAQIAQQGGP